MSVCLSVSHRMWKVWHDWALIGPFQPLGWNVFQQTRHMGGYCHKRIYWLLSICSHRFGGRGLGIYRGHITNMRSWCRTYSLLCLDVTCAQLVTSLEIARKHDKNNMMKRHMIHTMMWWYEGLDRPASLVHVLLDSASQVRFLIVPGAGVTSVQRQHARNAKNQGDIEDTMNLLSLYIYIYHCIFVYVSYLLSMISILYIHMIYTYLVHVYLSPYI